VSIGLSVCGHQMAASAVTVLEATSKTKICPAQRSMHNKLGEMYSYLYYIIYFFIISNVKFTSSLFRAVNFDFSIAAIVGSYVQEVNCVSSVCTCQMA